MNSSATDLTRLLNDAEMDRLDDFLLSRLPEQQDANSPDADTGVLCISELHGYFTAVLTVPKHIQPEQWLAHLWGDFSPAWESDEHGEAMFSLLQRFKFEVSQSLSTPGFVFDPCFNERQVNGQLEIVRSDWCSGYLRGSQFLPADGPYLQDPEFSSPMMVIKANTLIDGVDVLALMAEKDPAAAERLRNSVPEAARDLFAYWAAARNTKPASPGRNDPCRCGSGKKFKHCCLH